MKKIFCAVGIHNWEIIHPTVEERDLVGKLGGLWTYHNGYSPGGHVPSSKKVRVCKSCMKVDDRLSRYIARLDAAKVKEDAAKQMAKNYREQNPVDKRGEEFFVEDG